MKVTPERLRRLERGRHGVGAAGAPSVLRARKARLEAKYARIRQAAEVACAEGAPNADALLDEWLSTFWAAGICPEIERIRRAMLSPVERAREDRHSRERQAYYETLSIEQLDLEVERLLAKSCPHGASTPR